MPANVWVNCVASFSLGMVAPPPAPPLPALGVLLLLSLSLPLRCCATPTAAAISHQLAAMHRCRAAEQICFQILPPKTSTMSNVIDSLQLSTENAFPSSTFARKGAWSMCDSAAKIVNRRYFSRQIL